MAAMVRCYCRGHHGSGANLCADCQALLCYASARLDRCRFGAQKPTCARCPVHCYAPQWREKTRAVMRYSGPRMIWRHPWLALCHWVDSYRHVAAPGRAEAAP